MPRVRDQPCIRNEYDIPLSLAKNNLTIRLLISVSAKRVTEFRYTALRYKFQEIG